MSVHAFRGNGGWTMTYRGVWQSEQAAATFSRPGPGGRFGSTVGRTIDRTPSAAGALAARAGGGSFESLGSFGCAATGTGPAAPCRPACWARPRHTATPTTSSDPAATTAVQRMTGL